MDLQVGGSSPLTHPICYPHANQGIVLTTKLARMGDFSSVEGSIPQFTPEETLAYISYIQKYASQQPRTYWVTIPFYTVIKDHKQQFRFGYRPEDLAHIDTIEQKAWEKHEVYLKRLERFPLDKAEYYARMKEIHGISTVREIAAYRANSYHLTNPHGAKRRLFFFVIKEQLILRAFLILFTHRFAI